MIIGIDGNEANVEEKVGVSVYTFELLKYFSKQASEKLKFVIYLRGDPRADLPKENKFFCYEVVKSPALWRDIFLPAKLYSGERPDVFFSPAHYTPRFCPVPLVVTIHDLSYEYYPDEFLKKDLLKLKNWTKHAVQNASKIIAVSENTKKDIIKFYKIPEDKIKVIYNGYKKYQETSIKQQINFKFQISNFKFILYVGTLQPRKNLLMLIDCFYQLINEGVEHKLVIVGKKGWMYDQIFEKVKALGIEDKVVFTGYLTNDELSVLYRKAEMFVMPSLYEGFCIPLLETMSYGAPIVASNTSSLPEVGGNACLYFDPNDKIDMKEKILKVLKDKKVAQLLIMKGKKRIKNFSWHKCASQTLNALQYER